MSKGINTEVNAAGQVVTTVTEVAPWRVDLLKAKGQAINKRAIKLGMPQILFSVSPVYTVERSVVDPFLGITKVQVPVVDITVTGNQIKLAGHTVVGTVEAIGDADSLLLHLPEFSDLDLSQYRGWKGQCDHCHKIRSRKSAVILKAEDGTLLVVGKSCLVDFTGAGLDPEFLALYAAFHTFEGGGGSEDGWDFGGYKQGISPLSILVATVALARCFGWCSKKQAQAYAEASDWVKTLTTTSEYVCDYLLNKNRASRSVKEIEAKLAEVGGITDADSAKALEILEWAKTVSPGNSDYLYNLKALCSAAYVPTKRLGFVVSAYGSYAAQQLRDAAPGAGRAIPKGFIGTVGQRINVEAEVERVHYSEGQYGCTTILSLVDAEGHKLTWFASGSRDFEKGQRVAGKATVKLHKQDPKWGDSTILTRCAFWA